MAGSPPGQLPLRLALDCRRRRRLAAAGKIYWRTQTVRVGNRTAGSRESLLGRGRPAGGSNDPPRTRSTGRTRTRRLSRVGNWYGSRYADEPVHRADSGAIDGRRWVAIVPAVNVDWTDSPARPAGNLTARSATTLFPTGQPEGERSTRAGNSTGQRQGRSENWTAPVRRRPCSGARAAREGWPSTPPPTRSTGAESDLRVGNLDGSLRHHREGSASTNPPAPSTWLPASLPPGRTPRQEAPQEAKAPKGGLAKAVGPKPDDPGRPQDTER